MILNLISGPRNVSTALMYSFAQRSEARVLDEPFYAYYLQETGIDHPGRQEVLESQPTTKEEVLSQIFAIKDKKLVVLKNMAHHLLMEQPDFLLEMKNVILIRDLKQLILSFSKVILEPTLSDIGIKKASELFDFLSERGKEPVVLNTNELLKNPEGVLRQLCEMVGIQFDERMLAWEPGPREEDGVWAKYWYKNVHTSTGLQPKIFEEVKLAAAYQPLYETALPYFEKLNQYAIRA